MTQDKKEEKDSWKNARVLRSSSLIATLGQEEQTGWRERFDNKAVAENYRGQDPYWPDWEGVKSFIETELARARKEERERIVEWARGAIKDQLDKNDLDNYGACYAIGGFNDALQKLLSKLEEESHD